MLFLMLMVRVLFECVVLHVYKGSLFSECVVVDMYANGIISMSTVETCEKCAETEVSTVAASVLQNVNIILCECPPIYQ